MWCTKKCNLLELIRKLCPMMGSPVRHPGSFCTAFKAEWLEHRSPIALELATKLGSAARSQLADLEPCKGLTIS